MAQKKWKFWLIGLLILCGGIIVAGGIRYVSSLRTDLRDQAVENVLTVTRQQQQAFDTFISEDRERLHSYAEYFSRNSSTDTAGIQNQLKVFGEVDAFYTVINLSDGSFCGSRTDEVFHLRSPELEVYRSLSGSGVRDPFTGLYTDDTMFGYYERFTFADGVQGLVQKSYNSSKVSNAFSLSFYNDQGFSYVVNQKGDILLRSNGLLGGRLYDNIFDVLSDFHHGGQQSSADLEAALSARETGSVILSGESGAFVYTFVPVENVAEWFLVSIVPESAITAETDQILLNSQVTLLVLTVLLLICAVFIALMWFVQRNIAKKDREIQYQEELFNIFSSHLSQNTNDVYLMLDLERQRVEYVSPNVERVLGVPPAEISANIRAYAGSSGEEQHLDADEIYAMKPGDSLEPIATTWINPRTKESQWFQVNLYCTSVQEEPRLVIYISDRTEERKNQQRLSEALSLAQMANHAKSSFLSSVSHDIRTPMNAIIGLMGLLRQEADNPEVVLEYAQRIDAASQHLLGLINDVLDMNKIESGSASLSLNEMDMAAVIEEINTIIRPQAKAKNQTFEIFVSSLIHEYLRADKLRINQVLINLLSNAVKYTQEGGKIQMRVEELPQVVEEYGRIRFTISDNGMGMSEEYQKIIFDPFTREDSAAIRQIQGTGLGMAITKSLVDLMGGTIKVESVPGEGSTFTVELELFILPRENDPEFWREHRVSRMIVADDEEEVCKEIVKTMDEVGVVTDYSTDGQTAVQMMRQARERGEPYDLILLDWKMPGLDGLETAQLIRKNYPEKIPILLLTAYEWGEIEQEAREIGINHFMPKPFFMSTFKDAIRRVMGGLDQAERAGEDSLKGRRILVVDDIEVNRIILVKILSGMGAECDTAKNGQEALEAFEQSPPGAYDVILMDVQMPVMDGYAATKAIRAGGHPDAKAVPIIAMTANAFVDDVRDAIESGMDAHVAKPVQVDKLTATIHQVMENRAQKTGAEERGSIT